MKSALSYKELALNSEHWIREAEQLFAVAKSCLTAIPGLFHAELHDEDRLNMLNGHFNGGLLLLAFSVENALKAVAIYRGEFHELITEGEHQTLRWNKDWRKHDLVNMANSLKFNLTELEKEAMKRLTIFGLWGGRYPTPSNKGFYEEEVKKLQFRPNELTAMAHFIESCKSQSGYDEKYGLPMRDVDIMSLGHKSH